MKAVITVTGKDTVGIIADVSAVCAAFGGGGHVRAAGCTLTDFASIDDAVAAVVAEIEKQL